FEPEENFEHGRGGMRRGGGEMLAQRKLRVKPADRSDAQQREIILRREFGEEQRGRQRANQISLRIENRDREHVVLLRALEHGEKQILRAFPWSSRSGNNARDLL